jgi:hypothetical protein
MRAQQSDEVAAIERWLGQVGAAAKVFPAVMNVVDIMQWARDLALRLNVPGKVLRSVKEAETMLQQQQQAAALQARAQIAAQQGHGDEGAGRRHPGADGSAERRPGSGMRRIVLDYVGLTCIVIGGVIFAGGSLLLRKAKKP